VSDIMIRDVLTLHPDDAMRQAFQNMKKHCIRHMVVCENGKLLGILSDLDVQKWEACREIEPSYETWKVSRCMSKSVHTVRESDPLSEAVEWLALGHYHALPVENEVGELTGIVTTTDMLHVLMKMIIDRGTRL